MLSYDGVPVAHFLGSKYLIEIKIKTDFNFYYGLRLSCGIPAANLDKSVDAITRADSEVIELERFNYEEVHFLMRQMNRKHFFALVEYFFIVIHLNGTSCRENKRARINEIETFIEVVINRLITTR